MRERTWMVFLVIGFAAGSAAALLGPTAQGAVALPLGLCASTFAFVIAKREPGPMRRTWTLFGLAGTGFLTAGVVQTVAEAMGIDTFPAPSHLIYVLGYGALIAGTYRMGSIRAPGRNAAAHVDG